MLLTGAFQRSLDDKHRFSIPKPVRDALQPAAGTPLFLTPGTDGSLAMYPESVLSDLGRQLGQSTSARDARTFNRLFYAQAHRVELDKQGRVRIPSELVRWAALEREIVLLGVRDHLELWSQNSWERFLAENQMRFDQIADGAFQGDAAQPEDAVHSKPR